MKNLLIAGLVVFAVGALATGVVFAQSLQPVQTSATSGYGPGPQGMGGNGPMHDYVEQALAQKLGLTEAQVEQALAGGKTMYQVALDNGIAEAQIPALLSDVHKTALAKAVTDGVLTQAQADVMLQRMTASGFGPANCPMGGQRPANGTGVRGGRGGGMMGGRGNRLQPTATP
jgi:hypothetical protein